MNSVQNMQDALAAAILDFMLIGEFAAVNYVSGIIKNMIYTNTASLDSWQRLFINEGMNSVTDLTKLALWTKNLNKGPVTA